MRTGQRPSSGVAPALCSAGGWGSATAAMAATDSEAHGQSLAADSGAGTALAHRRKPPLRSIVQQCPLGVAPGVAPSFAFGAWFLRTPRRPHTSPGPYFRCAGFGSCSANRCGAPSASGRRRAGQSPSRFKSPGRERVGSRLWSVVRLLCAFPPRLRAAGPGLSPLFAARLCGRWPRPGGLASRWGGGRFARPFPAAASGCLRRSVPAPTPPRFGLRRLRRRCFSYSGDVAF